MSKFIFLKINFCEDTIGSEIRISLNYELIELILRVSAIVYSLRSNIAIAPSIVLLHFEFPVHLFLFL